MSQSKPRNFVGVPLNKLCEKCQARWKLSGERFCLRCRKQLMKEMAESGYLEPEPKTKHDKKPVIQVLAMGELSLEDLTAAIAQRRF